MEFGSWFLITIFLPRIGGPEDRNWPIISIIEMRYICVCLRVVWSRRRQSTGVVGAVDSTPCGVPESWWPVRAGSAGQGSGGLWANARTPSAPRWPSSASLQNEQTYSNSLHLLISIYSSKVLIFKWTEKNYQERSEIGDTRKDSMITIIDWRGRNKSLSLWRRFDYK